MGIFDKIFGKKDEHDHSGHAHFDCATCRKQFHTKSELEAHQRSAHPK